MDIWHPFRTSPVGTSAELEEIKVKFNHFSNLLDVNAELLKLISDLVEKSHGEYLFDINYVHDTIDKIVSKVQILTELMIHLGGVSYNPLIEKFKQINQDIDWILAGHRNIEKSSYCVRYRSINRNHINIVGSKNAQLGELATKLNLPVPYGFAITAWAYKRFMDAGKLQARISKRISSIDIKKYDDLVRFSRKIREMIVSSPVPDDLAAMIDEYQLNLAKRVGLSRFSVRSSAIGEDSHHSFAGQYATYLNVPGEDVVKKYRQVLASKFGPKAIYYYLSHDFSETDLAMCVGCVGMVDAIASGVVYTCSPVNPDKCNVIITSIYGLGTYLVEGNITPDTFEVDRHNRTILSATIQSKAIRLVTKSDGGTKEEAVPEAEQRNQSISNDHILQLTEYALKIENHYGTPQDIEWAIDRSGELSILQTRPLQVFQRVKDEVEIDTSEYKTLNNGGTTICPGAGSGKPFHINSADDLQSVPTGSVLIVRNPFLRLITVMEKISALVTEVGSVASHIATIAREYRLPTIMGMTGIDKLDPNSTVTVDATGTAIYEGDQRELIASRKPNLDLYDDLDLLDLVERLLSKISPLNLLSPQDDNFTIESCKTFHDIIRFCHQKSMKEMFASAQHAAESKSAGQWLKSSLPLPIRIMYIDGSINRGKWIPEDKVNSRPFKMFWSGILEEGWPKHMNVNSSNKLKSAHISRRAEHDLDEVSFAVLSKEYMVLSLRMGYHFTTYESMLSEIQNRNYIRMHFKGGGATTDRRLRRIGLIADILAENGFTNSVRGDFLDTMISNIDSSEMEKKLHLLGRLTMMAKQLDMALSSDELTEWYKKTFTEKLQSRCS